MSSKSRREKAARRRRGRLTIVHLPPPAPNYSSTALLEDLLGRLREGTEQADGGMVIFWFENSPDGGQLPMLWSAGLSLKDKLAAFELAKQMTLDDWREGGSHDHSEDR